MMMRTVRRVTVVFTLAAIAAAGIKLRCRGEVPVQTGGWRELSGTDLQ